MRELVPRASSSQGIVHSCPAVDNAQCPNTGEYLNRKNLNNLLSAKLLLRAVRKYQLGYRSHSARYGMNGESNAPNERES